MRLAGLISRIIDKLVSNLSFWSHNMNDFVHWNVDLAIFIIRIDDCFYRSIIFFGFEYIPIKDIMHALRTSDDEMQFIDSFDIDPNIALRITILKNALHMNRARAATAITPVTIAHVDDNNPNTSQVSSATFLALITAPM